MEGQQQREESLAYLQSTMRAIESACTSIQMHANPATAEATILSLSRSPQPYKACKFIMGKSMTVYRQRKDLFYGQARARISSQSRLENSQLANARFQAAGGLCDAAIREWNFLSSDDRKGLVNMLVPQRDMFKQRYGQWLLSCCKEVNQAILGSHGLQVQFVGINFLESLVSELSPTTSSAMGLPREFHEQCQKSLELDYLKVFYCWTRDAALGVATRIIESDSAADEAEVCTSALREVLLSSGDVVWLLELYTALRQKFLRDGFWIDCPIAVAARNLILQFCSLTGTVFPSVWPLALRTTQRLVVPFEMRGFQGVYNLEKKICAAAVRGLSAMEGPLPVRFTIPDPCDPFSLKPGSLSLPAAELKVANMEKSSSLSAAIAGARAAATQFSKKKQGHIHCLPTRAAATGKDWSENSEPTSDVKESPATMSSPSSHSGKSDNNQQQRGTKQPANATPKIFAKPIKGLKPFMTFRVGGLVQHVLLLLCILHLYSIVVLVYESNPE